MRQCTPFPRIFLMAPKLTFIVGCTASGKSGLGRELARHVDGEIVSIDSMKVYRRMDIGTGKPSREVRQDLPHHLIDVVEPSDDFSVARYVELAERAIEEIDGRGKAIFVVGGTPLYVKGLTEGLFEGPGADQELRATLHDIAAREGTNSLYQRLRAVDPQSTARIHPNDLRRIVRALEVFELTGRPISELQTQWDPPTRKYECAFFGLRREREDQNHRTNDRVRRMIEGGLVDEVRALLAEPKRLGETARKAVGYAEIIDHLAGKTTLADAAEMIKINTRRLAKAQRTWFKRFREIEWIDLEPHSTAAEIAEQLLDRRGSLWKA